VEQISKILRLEILRLGEASITIGQVLIVALTIAVALVLAGWLIRKLSLRLLKGGRDANQVQLINRVLWVAVLAILFFTALGMLNVPLGAFAFISGAIAIGIGFGAQNIINNFISGWILMGERPIRIGDLLEVNGTLGRVEAINVRSTRIKRVDGVRIVIPNSHLLENMVVNWNLGDEDIRIFVSVGVAYGSPVRRVAELIEQAVNEQEDVLRDPEPRVLFQDFGNSALLFEAYFWTQLRPGGDLRRLRSEIRFRIDELFRENGITIAFPQQDVHLDGILKLDSGDREAGQTIPSAPEEH
jgi:small-conductance mechanosensitive channel